MRLQGEAPPRVPHAVCDRAGSVFACASGPSMGCSRKCSKESASKDDGDRRLEDKRA